MARELTTQEFDSFVAENPVALVDFSAAWCGPCQALKPVLEKLSESHEGVAVVDIDRNPELAMRFNVQSVPTVVLFKNGQPVDQIVGLAPPQVFEQRLDALAV